MMGRKTTGPKPRRASYIAAQEFTPGRLCFWALPNNLLLQCPLLYGKR